MLSEPAYEDAPVTTKRDFTCRSARRTSHASYRGNHIGTWRLRSSGWRTIRKDDIPDFSIRRPRQ